MATVKVRATATPRESEQRVRSILERIRTPNAVTGRIGACLYGGNGAGKTTILATMPGRGLVIDVPQFEGGTNVLSEHAGRIDVIEANEWNDFEDIALMLESGKHDYKWYALDTVTGAQKLAKIRTLHERPIDFDPTIIDQQDWGKIGEYMERMTLRLRALPLHGIFLAQENYRDKEGMWMPDITPAARRGLLPSMFLVGRMYVREVHTENGVEYEHLMRVGPGERTTTKQRANPGRDLPPVLKNPDLNAIFAWMLGNPKAERPEEATTESIFSL